MRRLVALFVTLAALTATAVLLLAAPARPATRPAAGPDHPAAVRAVGAVSASYPLTDVTYGQDGGPLPMDIYLPSGASGPVPVVLVVHGGGWSGGTRADTAPQAQALARAGMAALNVDYRLATPATPAFPAQLSDLEQAIDWVRANSATYGLDPSRIGVLGLSAGGNLALDLGVRGLVSAVVAWSPPTDLTAFETPDRVCTTAACGPLSLPWAVYQELGCLPTGCPATYEQASPGAFAAASPAGLRTGPDGRGVRLSLWNSASELVPQAQVDTMTNVAGTDGAPDVEEHVLPGALHAGQYAATSQAPSVAFLAAALGARSTPA